MKCANHPEIDAVGVCIGCGKNICEICKVSFRGEIYCKQCTVEKTTSSAKTKKSPILAAILSFIIGGLGQVYNGQVGKGLLIFFTSWLIIPWIYGIIDAYRTANKINEGIIIIPQRTGCVIATICLMVLTPFFIAILGILAAIAIPNFLMARGTVQAKMCINNLNYIEQVKQMYADENGLTPNSQISPADINGKDDGDGIPDILEKYFDIAPRCPSGGKYNIGAIGEKPICSIGNNNTYRQSDDHILHGQGNAPIITPISL